MTVNHHTQITSGSAVNAASVNSPLGEIDSAITDLEAGDSAITGQQLASATVKTIAVGVLTVDQIIHTITSESGTADVLTSIAGLNNGEIVYLQATATHTITIENGTIKCISGSDETMTNTTLFLFINVGGTYYCLDTAGASSDAADITYTPAIVADWNGDADPGNVDDALDELAAARTSYALLRDEKATTVDGGASSAATWNARDLNTEVYDNKNIVTIASDQFTPIAGEYKITVAAPANNVGAHKLRLFNVTGVASVDEGQNAQSSTGDTTQTHAHFKTFFTANGTDAYRIDHYTNSAKATNGLGIAVSDGSNEVYLESEF